METIQLKDIFELSRNNPEIVTMEATVTSGLEKVAEDECFETFGKHTLIVVNRGKIYFNIPMVTVYKVFTMRSIDNVYIVVHLCNVSFVSEKNEDLLILKQQYAEMNWRKALSVWMDVYKFPGKVYPTKEEYEAYLNLYVACNINDPNKCKGEKRCRASNGGICGEIPEVNEATYKLFDTLLLDDKIKEMLQDPSSSDANIDREEVNLAVEPSNAVPTFRVSAKRVGSHSFTSEDVAKMFGAVIQEDFLWIVDLTNFNVEIMTDTIDSELIVSISLTKFSLHRRNLTAFGITSLRATICYSLIRLALPKVGDIVLDPLAGSGSIPLEGALAFPGLYFLAGDSQENACKISNKNFNHFSSESNSLPIDLLKWNALNLPIKTSTVDIIVTDLPFGKRSGSKRFNKVLYPGVLKELGRVAKKGSGKAVLLTTDRRTFEISLCMRKNLWRLTDRRLVNVGGLKAVVYILIRSMFD